MPTIAAIVSTEMEPENGNPSTTVAAENLQLALNLIERKEAVENLDISLNPRTTATTEEVAGENLEMALNSATTSAAVLDIVPNTMSSKSEATPSPLLPWTVDNFGTFPKKARSGRGRYEPTSEEEYLAECLEFLSRSSGSSTRNISKSLDITPPNSKPLNNEKKKDFLEPQNRSYECTICNKSFTTYQALGGHKSSHNNKPAENNVGSTSAALRNVSSPNLSGRSHRCTICDKSFDTGQALGGHKRLHYKQICNTRGGGDNSVFTDTSREQDMIQSQDLFLERKSSSDVIFHNFDLNLLPQLEPEEQLNTDSEMMTTEVSGNEVDQGHLPMKKRCLSIKLDLHLSLP